MTRHEASKHARLLLDAHDLKSWGVRLTTDASKPFLGLCSYKDKCIILNAHHIDIHPSVDVINTIRHEVAHALTPFHSHDEIWRAKAIELGCDNTNECSNLALSPDIIDAIRSGAEIEVEFTERVETIRDVKYKVNKLQDKCVQCGKVAIIKSKKDVNTSSGRMLVITLECGHIEVKNSDSKSSFELLTFDGDSKCRHEWGKGPYRTTCTKCRAKRLYEYQVEGARALERANGRLAIFDEMGLGKTIQALAYLKYTPESFPYLWVTKSGIKYQHMKEIMRVLGDDYFPQVISTGRMGLIPNLKGYLASYDIFRNFDFKKFEAVGIKSIILDECQAISNPDSARTRAIQRVVKGIPKIIPLSGTPWKNRGSEFFTVLNMLDPKRFHSYAAFERDWVVRYYEGGKTKTGGIDRPEKFKEFISDIAIRRERIEVMPELPLINRTRMLCEVPEHARKVYQEEQDKLERIVNDSLIDGTENSFATAQAINASLMVMKQIVGIAKVPTTIEFAKEFLEDTDRKLVIFVHHVACGDLIQKALEEYCKAEGLPEVLRISSDMDPSSRFQTCEKFNSPNYRLMIASTLASGEGLNLQTCSDCIMHERQWNPANEEQAEGRFIRIGQQASQVNATYMHGDNTIDTILDSIVETKRIAFHSVMNKGQMPVWNEGSLIKQVITDMFKGK